MSGNVDVAKGLPLTTLCCEVHQTIASLAFDQDVAVWYGRTSIELSTRCIVTDVLD
jgi:hypothetical protein